MVLRWQGLVSFTLLGLVGVGCDESSPDDSADMDGMGENDEGETEDGGSGTGGGCPNADGDNPHGIEPDSPDDPEIVEACVSWCAQATSGGCGAAADCTMTCRQRACYVCPGSLAPFVDCLSENYSAEECTCGASGPQCDQTEACQDLRFALGACGG